MNSHRLFIQKKCFIVQIMKIAWVQLSHTIYFWFEQAAVETTSGVLITTVLQRWSTIQPCFPTLKGFQAVTDHNSHALKGLHSGCTGSNLSSVYVCVIFFQRIPQHRSFTRWHVFTRGDMHSRVLQMPAMTNSPACRRGHSNTHASARVMRDFHLHIT